MIGLAGGRRARAWPARVMQGVTRNPLADPGHPGHRGRRGAGRRGRHLQLRDHLADGLRVVRVRRRGGGERGRVRARLHGPGRGHAREAGPGRGGAGRPARLVHVGDPAARRRHPRPVPVLGGGLARRPGRRRSSARSSRSSSSARCSPSATARPLNALALGDDVARSLGQRVQARPGDLGGGRRHPVRRGGGGGRPDRVRRPHHPARGPRHLRARLPLGAAVVHGARPRSCC